MLTDHLLLAQLAGGNSLSPFILIAGMFAIMYFLMIRPQQKQLKEHRALLSNLKKGDTVVTQGGIIGKIFLVAEREVQIEVANNVKLRVLKTSVQSVVKGHRRAREGRVQVGEGVEVMACSLWGRAILIPGGNAGIDLVPHPHLLLVLRPSPLSAERPQGAPVQAASLGPSAQHRLNLGLDLQGGIHMVMRVDTQTALQKRVERRGLQIGNYLKDRRPTASP